ncbi:unnamed protein product (macronuclear) [Paramecium tetraurelia]|uniref:Uncharacterized protein n=1 Tax=Paramecium tetraurelia TaxID=5888 RepID=A0CP14_PARTE|nr:uncharacterized protein GSPATT00008922001 [Paramecium tetraurelia]CAK72531.1 unnamed protein product [Paramecium tetraurelia]|eukprot:XP_001439928.1 hypothetical protein (macronuclear) [Paramecium tetraurelia strain d4-2]
MFRRDKENFIEKQGLVEADGKLKPIEDQVKGLPSVIDFLYIGSDIQVFYKEHNIPCILVVRMETQFGAKLYCGKLEKLNTL